jgi:hypothetical protein
LNELRHENNSVFFFFYYFFFFFIITILDLLERMFRCPYAYTLTISYLSEAYQYLRGTIGAPLSGSLSPPSDALAFQRRSKPTQMMVQVYIARPGLGLENLPIPWSGFADDRVPGASFTLWVAGESVPSGYTVACPEFAPLVGTPYYVSRWVYPTAWFLDDEAVSCSSLMQVPLALSLPPLSHLMNAWAAEKHQLQTLFNDMIIRYCFLFAMVSSEGCYLHRDVLGLVRGFYDRVSLAPFVDLPGITVTFSFH